MSHSQRAYACVSAAVLTAVVLLNGCASSRPQSFAMSFLPATPIPEPNVRIEEPPRVTASLYTRAVPNFVATIPPEVEKRLRTAEERFEAGKKAYQTGDA